jgi:hypothetical protein
MSIILLPNRVNPDSQSIADKDRIDISLTAADILASEQSKFIKTNYSVTAQFVFLDSTEDSEAKFYYTPLYTEALKYETWLSRINKNFQELN